MNLVPTMVAMSGGVDSSLAAALLVEEGRDVVGVTLRLWGGESDSGCCAVSDVEDARRVCDTLGIDHYVFNLGEDFNRQVVDHYVDSHASGQTPNPCIECNRHIKFGRLLRRARTLGFTRLATGHHARIVKRGDGILRIARSVDRAKDQSYVLHMLDQDQIASLELPVGELTKDEVRERASHLGLRTANKPDSQDVCFVTREYGRSDFLARRIPLTPGRVVDTSGLEVGRTEAVEMVTIGQRRGMNLAGAAAPRYAISVDVPSATVVVGSADDLVVDLTRVHNLTWADGPVSGPVLAQSSAHSEAVRAELVPSVGGLDVRWADGHRRVAPGQSVVFYEGDEVLGGGLAG